MFPAIAACCMLQDSCVTTLLWMLSLIATPTELGVVIASQLSGCSPPLETHVFLRRIALGSIGEYFNRRKRKHCRSIVKLGDQRDFKGGIQIQCACIISVCLHCTVPVLGTPFVHLEALDEQPSPKATFAVRIELQGRRSGTHSS